MYHFANHSIFDNGYDQIQQSSLFGLTAAEPASVNVQKDQPESVPQNPQLPVNKPPKKSAEVVKEGGKKKEGAGKKGAVDSSAFSVEERIVAAVWVHERRHNNLAMGQIKQQFEQRFGRAAPTKNTLLAWERKLFAQGSVHDAPRSGRPARRKLLAAELCASLRSAPELSMRARAVALRVPRSTLQALMHKDIVKGCIPPVIPAKKKKKKSPRAPPAPQPAPPAPPHPAGDLT